MRKYLLSVLAIIAATIIAAETAELALDANGNTSKIFIPRTTLLSKSDQRANAMMRGRRRKGGC